MVCHANGNNCTRRDIVTAGTGYTAQNPMSMGINAIINIVLQMTGFIIKAPVSADTKLIYFCFCSSLMFTRSASCAMHFSLHQLACMPSKKTYRVVSSKRPTWVDIKWTKGRFAAEYQPCRYAGFSNKLMTLVEGKKGSPAPNFSCCISTGDLVPDVTKRLQ